MMADKIYAVNEKNKEKVELSTAPCGYGTLSGICPFCPTVIELNQELLTATDILFENDDATKITVVANVTGVDAVYNAVAGLLITPVIVSEDNGSRLYFLLHNTSADRIDSDKVNISYATIRHI